MVEIKEWTNGVEVEGQARQQLNNIASMPFVRPHLAVMPDVHWGMGATVGSVIPTIGAIIPAAIGVDIGCGMMAVKTSLNATNLPDNLFQLRCSIESAVPHGRTDNGGLRDKGAFREYSDQIRNIAHTHSLKKGLDSLVDKYPALKRAAERAFFHMGTLGTGNHFIELCLDETNQVWIMLHSGSRGIGNKIGNHFISLAKKDMKRWFINLPDADLAYIPDGSELFNDYIFAVSWAQSFAQWNRNAMMENVINAIQSIIAKSFHADIKAINCHHNYVSKEYHFGKDVYLTRKGAVHINEGVFGIVPGSMGAKSYIVEGIKGPALRDSFNSCSHGAGRAMSRNEAKKRFTLEDHKKAVHGVECRLDEDVIDETPMAYKDIDAVMAAQADHVKIVHTLKQVLCVKG